MLKRIGAVFFAVVFLLFPFGYAFAEELSVPAKAVTQGAYSEGDLLIDRTTGVENITGYDYIYSNPPTSDLISITLQNTADFKLQSHYYYGGLHNCFMNSLIYTGGGFGDNRTPKEIPGDIALVRIADSVKNGAGEKFDLLLQIKNLVITPDPAYCLRDPEVGVSLLYYQEKADPIISTDPAAYDDFGTATQGPTVYGRYTVEFEYELKVVISGSNDTAPRGTMLYGSRDFDSYREGYDIVSGIRSGTDRDAPTIYVEPDSITDITFDPANACYRICGTAADENTWRSGFAALFDSSGSTLRWFGFRSLGTTIIGQEAYEFSRYYNVRGEILKGEGSIDPVDVTVAKGMNVNCVIDPADDFYISSVRLYTIDDSGEETLEGIFDTQEVMNSDTYCIPINSIDKNYRYEVEFEKRHLVTLDVVNGRVGESGDVTHAEYYVVPGGAQDLTYSGYDGFCLRSIDVDGTLADIEGHSTVYSFSDVCSDHHVTVTYGAKYNIETSVINGTITEGMTVWEGEDALIRYSPDEGHHIQKITVDGAEVDINEYPVSYIFRDITTDHRIEVVYQANSTMISKVDETGNNVPGAELQILNEEGNVLDQWVTGSEDHVIFSLGEGTYTLAEKTAPSGYLTAEDVVFNVDSSGKLIIEGEVKDKVIMVDIRMRSLPSTGSNGLLPHMIIMGAWLTMLSTAVVMTRRV